MITNFKKKNLIKFEEEIANLFNNAKIRAPVHYIMEMKIQ